MSSLEITTVLIFLIISVTFADDVNIILKRLEEMDMLLANQGERIAQLEKENVKKADTISTLRGQLETVNLQKAAEIISLQKQLKEESQENDAKIFKLQNQLEYYAAQISRLINKQDENDGVNDELFGDIVENDQKSREDVPINTDGAQNDTSTNALDMQTGDSLSRKGRLVLSTGMQVAFSATITPHDYGPVGKGQILLFDNVITNVNNAYHAHSGIFTSPVDGVYVIYVTIAGLKPSIGESYIEIVKNGQQLCFIWVTSAAQSSQALIVSLSQGEEIYVRSRNANDILLGQTYSSFSGFLLY